MKSRILIILSAVILFLVPNAGFGQAAPNLGTTSSFALFTGTGASFTSPTASTVTGDIGASTAPTYTVGLITLTGNSYIPGSGTSATAAADVLTAYSDMTQAPTGVLGVTIVNGDIILPGVYNTGAATSLDGTVTLDGQSLANPIFIIRIGGAFSVGTTTASNFNLINGASFCNVFWQVDGAFSLAVNSSFGGTLISTGAISLASGSSIFGRALSTAGAISLDNTTVTITPPPPSTPGAITGTLAQCPATAGQTYSIVAVAGATSYTWTVPAGWSVTAGAGTTNITVTTGAFGENGNITVTADNGCGTSAASSLAVTVNPTLPVSVSVVADANPVCAGTTVNYTATPTNGGAAPVYQWKVNGINVGVNSPTYSYVPLTTDAVTVVLTSNAACPTGNPATSAAVNMTVNASLPVSVAMVADANPVCAGTTVNYTATPTNGGAAPVYQWKVNGINVGVNSPTYSYVPLTTDAVTVVLTSNAACPTGNPATSAAVNMTVNASLPVSVAMVADANPVCAGTTVNYTATPTNGGAAPVYQWKVNGINVGVNSPTYSYVPLTTDAVTVVLTSNAACPTGNPATSAAVNMTVNASLPVSVAMVADANPVCAGTTVNYTATPTNGGAAPVYQWKVNGINVGVNSPTYSYVPLTTDAVTVVLTSNAACPTGNPATSAAVNMTVNASLPVSVAMVADANPVCAGTTVNYTATPTNGGAAPVYQWKVNGINVGVNSPTYSYVPLTTDAVTVVLTSNAACPTGNPATSAAVNMTVNASLPVSVAMVADVNPVCAGTTVNYTATPTNGGAAPVYQWKVNGINVGVNSPTYSYVPLTTDAVTVVLTSNAACPTGNPATSAAVNMTVNASLPVSVAMVADANPVCAGTTVNYTATPTNGGAAPVYQWKVNGINVGVNSPTYSYVPLTTDAVTVVLTSNAACPTGNPATSAAVNMTVNASLPVSVAMVADANPVCAGTTVNYTATPTNGGAAPVYQWKVNGINVGVNSPTYSYVPLTTDAVTVVLTSNAACPTGNPATSAAVNMTVNASLPVSVAMVADANPVCAGTTVNYTATPTNGGAAPVYQWKVNGFNVGVNSNLYSYIPITGDVVTVVLTSNAVCPTGSPATSAPVTMTVNPSLPVSVSISTVPAGAICAGTSVTFTATPTNGGLAPTYIWKKAGVAIVPAETNSTYTTTTLANGDAITVDMTSNAACPTGNPATSAAVNMTVNASLPVSVAMVADANPVCAGTTVNYTATPTNGGAAPVYQWKVNGINVGVNSPTYSYVPLTTDAVTVVLTSNAACPTGNPATSAAVNMTVNASLPVSVAMVADANPVCAGTTVNYTATPTNGGAAPVYQWKVNGFNVGVNSNLYSYIPITGDVVTVVLTSNAVCPTGSPATSAPVTMTVNPSLPVSVSISTVPAGAICAGTSVTFTATPTNGGLAPTYIWKKAGVAIVPAETNSTYTTTTLANGDAITVDMTSNAACVTGSPATSAGTTIIVSSPTLTSTQTNVLCFGGATGTATAIPAGGTGVYTYSWNTVPVQITVTATGLIAGTYTVTVTDANLCTATANVTITQPAAAVTLTSTQINILCFGSSTGAINITAAGGTAPYTYAWTGAGVAAAAEDQTGLAAGLYSVIVTDVNGCVSVSYPFTLTQPAAALTPPTFIITQPTCILATGSVVLNGLPAGNWTINPGAITGNALSTTVSGLTEGTYNYTVTNADGCTSSASADIVIVGTKTVTGCISPGTIVTINAQPPSPEAAGSVTGTTAVCQGQTGVVYSVPSIANATGYIWTLPAGATITAGVNTNSITVDFSEIAASGNITVEGTNPCDTGTVSVPFALTLNNCGGADLSVVTTVDNAYPLLGSTVVFKIVATNNGPNGSTGVIITNVLEDGYTYVSSSTSSGSYSPSTNIWTIGTLNNGATDSLTITATVTSIGNNRNTATIEGNETDENIDNNISWAETFPTDFFIPEGFSPNGDGINDELIIRGIFLFPENSIVIYNRWGNKVYEADPYINKWDGRSIRGLKVGGDELPVGTYFYLLNLGDGSEIIKGTFYLNR